MSTLYITRGLPAAGKTTWAKWWVAQNPERRARVNRDDLRAMVYDAPYLPWVQEETITVAQRASVLALLNAGLDVVADDTNLRPKYVREWRRWAAAHGHELSVVEFDVQIEQAIARDALRERPVGEEVIRRMVKYLRDGQLLPVPDEETPETAARAYLPRPGTPEAVIVDVDGTLALNTGGRSYYDLTRVLEDTPNENVIALLHMIRAAGRAKIIFCSGREDSCREDTEAWLEKHAGRTEDEPVLMRDAEDKRRDSLVKIDLFDTHIRDHYTVRFVLDDRDQVVKAWRAIGLTVYQVAEGAF